MAEHIYDYRALYALVIENLTHYAVFLTDLEGIIETWNPGVLRLLGYAESDFIGQPISVIFTSDDVQRGVPEAELRTAIVKMGYAYSSQEHR